jgi:hypothetical protein
MIMTKREMFAHIASVNSADAEIVDFCNHQIELLDTRKVSKTPTKTQKANEGLIEQIALDLAKFDKPVTVSELLASGERLKGLKGLSNQRVSALLRKMIESGQVVKTMEKKKALFSLA